jgi:hypothetical protein
MPEPTHTQVSGVPLNQLATPGEIAETIVFTGTIN